MKQREKTTPPQAASRIPEALGRLIELYTATNKPDEAKKWQAERAKYPAEKAHRRETTSEHGMEAIESQDMAGFLIARTKDERRVVNAERDSEAARDRYESREPQLIPPLFVNNPQDVA